tara:strand:+ start:271 stop:522 length:252 start_codon:yes stop_codon:yes gene_type:complete
VKKVKVTNPVKAILSRLTLVTDPDIVAADPANIDMYTGAPDVEVAVIEKTLKSFNGLVIGKVLTLIDCGDFDILKVVEAEFDK